MIKVKLFGSARVQFKEKEFEIEAKTVNDLIDLVAKRYQVKKKDIKQFLIYVNEVNIHELKMYRTKLNNNDVIMLLSPASGG